MTEKKLVIFTVLLSIFLWIILILIYFIGTSLNYLKQINILNAKIITMNKIIPEFDMRLSKLESNTGIGNANYNNFMIDLKQGKYEELNKEINTLPETMTELQYQAMVEKHGLQHYALFDKSYIYPISTKDAFITSEFGKRDISWSPNHTGIDLVNNKNLTIFCPKDGFILSTGYDASSDGYNILIQNDPNNRDYLCHAFSEFKFKKGEKLVQGQDIGTIGNTGVTEGQHLHWTHLTKIDGVWYIMNPVKNSTYNKRVDHGMQWTNKGVFYF